MKKNQKIKVGFLLSADGNDWQGGRNYFLSLMQSIGLSGGGGIQIFAFIGFRDNVSDLNFPPHVRIVRDKVFDRMSFEWIINKFFVLFLGRPLLSNFIIKKAGVHILSHSAPSLDRELPTVSWIPDFQHFYLPDFFNRKEIKQRNSTFKKYAAESDLVLVSSETSKKDFINCYPSQGYKVRMLKFCSIKPDFERIDNANVRALYDLEQPFFYLPNQLWAHKNHIVAIRALALLVKEYPDVKIFCTGSLSDYRHPKHFKFLTDEIESLNLSKSFIIHGLVPYEHILPLMHNSISVINPSLFEGWSTTVEEAKSILAPLIVSDIAVHHEQCDNQDALFFDPNSEFDLADRMIRRLSNKVDRKNWKISASDAYLKSNVDFAECFENIIHELS